MCLHKWQWLSRRIRYFRMDRDKPYLCRTIDQLPFSQSTKDTVYHYAMDAAKRSKRNKYLYYGMSLLVIFLPIVSSAINIVKARFSGAPLDWASLICNSSVTFLASMLVLFRNHEKWTRYRAYLEKMKNLIAEYSVLEVDAAQPATPPPTQANAQPAPPAPVQTAVQPAPPASAEPAPARNHEREFMDAFRGLNAKHQIQWVAERKNDSKNN